MRATSILFFVGLALALVAPAEAKRLRLHKPRRGFQMRMTPFPIAPDSERETCEFLMTPNREPMDVAAFEMKTTPGTHHFVVWEYLGKDRNPGDFWTGDKDAAGCVGLGPRDSFGATANLFGMLSGHQRVAFPDGVAVRLDPHAIVYANLHHHNYLTKPVDAEAVYNMIPARKGSVRHHAQALTVGSFQIDIPPQSHASLTGEWRTPAALNLIQVSTHQHRRGTLVSMHRLDAAGNDMGELVVSESWDHPTVRWFRDAPLRLEAGEGIRFTCEWQNPDDFPVTFGVTSEDEMCFVTGYFYPDVDGTKVRGPGCVPQGAGLECFVPKLQ